LIAYFLSNISAKYYENSTMLSQTLLSRVTAKNIEGVFVRQCSYMWSLSVMWQRWRSCHSICWKPRATRKPCGSVCYRTGVMVDQSFSLWK